MPIVQQKQSLPPQALKKENCLDKCPALMISAPLLTAAALISIVAQALFPLIGSLLCLNLAFAVHLKNKVATMLLATATALFVLTIALAVIFPPALLPAFIISGSMLACSMGFSVITAIINARAKTVPVTEKNNIKKKI